MTAAPAETTAPADTDPRCRRPSRRRGPGALWPTLAAVAVAGLIAALTKNLGFTILGGLAAAPTIG